MHGIGGVEYKMKENKSGKQANISTEKTKSQATIAGIHSQENNDEDHAMKTNTGLTWKDKDFETIGLIPTVCHWILHLLKKHKGNLPSLEESENIIGQEKKQFSFSSDK